MTVIEVMSTLSAMSEHKRVVIVADHGLIAEQISSIDEDHYVDNEAGDGELWHLDDLKEEGYDEEDFENVVVIWGQ